MRAASVFARAALSLRAPIFFAAMALGAHARDPALGSISPQGLAQLLGQAVGARVRPGDIAWEPSPGAIIEVLVGRRVLFLAGLDGGPRDLYRASVRRTPEGRAVAVCAVHNLTATPLGDEQSLIGAGVRAAYATASYGKVASLTLLDLRGARAEEGSVLQAWMQALTNWRETGSAEGLGRIDVQLEVPEEHLDLAFDRAGRLDVGFAAGGGLVVDASTGTVLADVPGRSAHSTLSPVLSKRPILWAVDTVRAEIGPEPVAWVEDHVYAARDWIRRAGYEWFGERATSRAKAGPTPSRPPSVLDAADTESAASAWPPPPIESIWSSPEPGEGKWSPVSLPWLKSPPGLLAAEGGATPPYFFRTLVRPDPERPYVRVFIVAMDMRQLELAMEGGIEDPKSLTGVHGAGKIPRDPDVLGRVVGAFNGAFKTTHGEYGMMVEGKVLLPPKPHAATLAVDTSRRVGLGTWGRSTAIPSDLVSFRQNLEPLVEDGKLLPSGRTQWGFQLAGTSLFTQRSGVCANASGQLYYFWGEELSGATLAKTMLQAGCTYGMHLDMNPHHTAFVFANVRSSAPKDFDVKLLTPAMEMQPERYLEWAPKDFFYLMVRDLRPTRDLSWQPDPGAQPAPSWLPAVWRGVERSRAGIDVELTAFDQRRVVFRLLVSAVSGRALAPRPGAVERPEAAAVELEPRDVHRALAALSLGVPAREPKAAPSTRAMGWLRVDPEGRLVVAPPGDPPPAADPSARLAWLSLDGPALGVEGDRRGLHARSALCLLPSGYAVLARSTADSDLPNAEVLAHVGCKGGVSLDAGAQLARVGRGAAPPAAHVGTTLFALARGEQPPVYRLESDGPSDAQESERASR